MPGGDLCDDLCDLETLIQKEQHARPPAAEYFTRQSDWHREYLTTDAAKRIVLLVRRLGSELSDGYDSFMDKRGREPLFQVRPRMFSQVDPPYKIVSAITGGDSSAAIQFKQSRTRREYRLQDYGSGTTLFFKVTGRRARLNATGNLSWEGQALLSAEGEAPCVTLAYSMASGYTPKTGISTGALSAHFLLHVPQEAQPLALGLLLTAGHFVLFRESVLEPGDYDLLLKTASGPREAR